MVARRVSPPKGGGYSRFLLGDPLYTLPAHILPFGLSALILRVRAAVLRTFKAAPRVVDRTVGTLPLPLPPHEEDLRSCRLRRPPGGVRHHRLRQPHLRY